MGIIQKQAMRSSFFLLVGFCIGGINILFLFPKLIHPLEVNGLTRALIDVATVLSVLATLGTIPVIYKFAPFYRAHLKKNENDLAVVSGALCLAGFIIICVAGYVFKDFIIRKLGKSPLFADNFFLVYPFTFLMLLFTWMESFAWNFKRAVQSNFLKETLVRLLTTFLILAAGFHFISTHQFIDLFSILYLIPVIILAILLRRTGEWHFNFRISKVTRRFGKKMIVFGLFIFGATFLNIASRTMDTFVIIGKKGLPSAAVFTLATYLATLMDLPARSISSVATPVIAESWRTKNYSVIFSVYKKSTVTLLVAAIFIFSLVVLNVDNLTVFLGQQFAEVPWLVFILGIAKIIDLGTGVNGQILGTSSFWKFDFFTNVFLTVLAFPLNLILITRYGIIGGAFATLISLTIFNLTRFIFLWRKYGWQPYGFSHLKILTVSIIIFLGVRALPFAGNIYLDTVYRSFFFAAVFVPVVLRMRVSDELNLSADKFLRKVRLKRSDR